MNQIFYVYYQIIIYEELLLEKFVLLQIAFCLQISYDSLREAAIFLGLTPPPLS